MYPSNTNRNIFFYKFLTSLIVAELFHLIFAQKVLLRIEQWTHLIAAVRDVVSNFHIL